LPSYYHSLIFILFFCVAFVAIVYGTYLEKETPPIPPATAPPAADNPSPSKIPKANHHVLHATIYPAATTV
jgi:hypothetical protein